MGNSRCIIAAVPAYRTDPPCLSPLRREKILRLKNDQARRLSAAAETALCMALHAFDPDVPLPPQYEYTPSGKPRLLSGFPHISLSHGGNYGVAAVSDEEIGVDAEGAVQVTPALMERCLSPEELAQCLQSPDPQLFFRSAWLARESYVKMTGEGLTFPLSRIRATTDSVNGCFLHFIPFDGHELALCARRKQNVTFLYRTVAETENFLEIFLE